MGRMQMSISCTLYQNSNPSQLVECLMFHVYEICHFQSVSQDIGRATRLNMDYRYESAGTAMSLALFPFRSPYSHEVCAKQAETTVECTFLLISSFQFIVQPEFVQLGSNDSWLLLILYTVYSHTVFQNSFTFLCFNAGVGFVLSIECLLKSVHSRHTGNMG